MERDGTGSRQVEWFGDGGENCWKVVEATEEGVKEWAKYENDAISNSTSN